MDNELAPNDPYRGMETGEDEIRPDFLSKKEGNAQKVLGAAEQLAAMKTGKAGKTGGVGGTGGAGGVVEGATGATGAKAAADVGAKEESRNGLYSGKKGAKENPDEADGKKLRIPTALKMAAPFLLILLAILGIIAVIIALPIFMIGAIDYNLQQALGFTGTVGILEEQAEYVTAELAKSGDFPTEYSSDLARNGVDVGQVTANGDFIKTDTYIADIENRDDLVAAASGFSYISEDEGELAMLYNGEIIRADDFVAKVESDPKLYAAFSGATNITSRYYYGKDVSKVFMKMGLVRGAFNNWQATGDYDTDLASYNEILKLLLDGNDTTLGLGGVRDDVPPTKWTPDCYVVQGDGSCTPGDTYLEYPITTTESSEIIGKIATQTKGYINAWQDSRCEDPRNENETIPCDRIAGHDQMQTKRAAELLNTAVSSREPYIAASTYMAIEESIQRARIDGDGPVNQLMNTISTPVSVTYENVNTGKKETKEIPIIETVNFQAAVGEKPYDKEEALNFSRDRALKMTGVVDTETIQDTTVSSNGGKNSTTAVRNGDTNNADLDTLMKANDAISKTVTEKNSDLFQSVIGANRILEGGSFISNNVNMKVIGAMPSDAATVATYQVEMDKTLARKAEAERASLSPFDISSPNTFLGSIVHNLATAVIGSYNSGASSITTAMQATGGAASDAISGIFGSAIAESPNEKFTAMGQSGCDTIGTVGVEGDLYCNSHNTVNTEHMNYTLEDWRNSDIGASIGPNGEIIEKSDLEKFVIMGMGREATVGVMNSEVCDAWHDYNDNIFEKIIHHIQDVVGMYQTCESVQKEDPDTATGAKYSFSSVQDSKLKLYSGYMLYNQVRSLLTGQDSSLALAQERYYSEHPQDNSEAGVLARISGMTKKEAEIALAYEDYLNEIANYDASTRYFFGPIDLGLGDERLNLTSHSAKIAGDYVAWYIKETEFKDLRSRNFVA